MLFLHGLHAQKIATCPCSGNKVFMIKESTRSYQTACVNQREVDRYLLNGWIISSCTGSSIIAKRNNKIPAKKMRIKTLVKNDDDNAFVSK